jgi:myosin heavy subunit
MAAESERLSVATNNLAAGFGESGQAMTTAIVEASGRTISEMDAMRAANMAMMFGIVDSKEEIAEMTQIAVTLGRAVGQDATKSMEDLTTALARQSPLILDNLGISLSLTDAYAIYAETLGKTVEQLTEQEKQQAFLNAALEVGRLKVQELGGVNNDLLSGSERLTASATNFKVAWGEAWNAFGFGAGATQLATYLLEEATYSLQQQNAETASGVEEYTGKQDELKTKLGEVDQATKDLILTQADYLTRQNDQKERLTELEKTSSDKQIAILNKTNEEIKKIEANRAAEIAKIMANEERVRNGYAAGDVERANKKYDEQLAAAKTAAQNETTELFNSTQEKRAIIEKAIDDNTIKYNLSLMEMNGTLSKATGGVADTAEEAFALYKAGMLKVTDDMKKEIPPAQDVITRSALEASKAQQEAIDKTGKAGTEVAARGAKAAQEALTQTRQQAQKDVFEIEAQARKSLDFLGRVIYDLTGLSSGMSSAASNFIKTIATGGAYNAGLGFASGGSFVVPPGYPGDSYQMGVSSGELVTVQPNITNNITQNNNFAGGGSMNLSYSMLQSMVGN